MAICIRCRREPCRCPREDDLVIELGDEIGRLWEKRVRLREIAPTLACWYETPKSDRVGPRPVVPRQHVAEVEQLLEHLLR